MLLSCCSRRHAPLLSSRHAAQPPVAGQSLALGARMLATFALATFARAIFAASEGAIEGTHSLGGDGGISGARPMSEGRWKPGWGAASGGLRLPAVISACIASCWACMNRIWLLPGGGRPGSIHLCCGGDGSLTPPRYQRSTNTARPPLPGTAVSTAGTRS